MMKRARYTDAEKNIMQDNIKDGVPVEVVQKLLPHRTVDAIARQARRLGFGVKAKNNILFFTQEKDTRIAKSKTGKEVISETVEESDVTTNNITSTELEHLNNESDDIISSNGQYATVIIANTKAMQFIATNNVNATSQDIKYLTDLILREASV